MIYGIERSTDMRAPNTLIRKFTSRRVAFKWLSVGARYTHADPEAARNWHHTIRRLFEMPKGWRKPSTKSLIDEARADSTPTYPRLIEDALASAIVRDGEELNP